MPIVAANGINIAYDEVGDAKAPVILLIMGLGTQMIAWPEAFCLAIAQRGFRVVRFDNRDIGLSTKFETAAPIDLAAAFARAMAKKSVDAPYTIDDMAADAIGLMDALGIGNAHVVGASMGGMIAQIIAARYANRTRSLTSIMSSSGDPGLPPGKPEAISVLLAPRPHPDDRENVIKAGMTILRVIGSPGFPTSEADLRAKVEQAADRSYYPPGAGRHLLAVLASGSRVELLKQIRVPTLVIHGADDPLVPVEGGEDTARHISGAVLKIIPGMGHDLANGLIPILVEAIADHCLAADAMSAAVPEGLKRRVLKMGHKPPPFALLATEGRGLLDIPALLAAAPFLAAAPRGQPHPVMVLPGLGADDRSTIAIRGFLESLGYQVHGWGRGRNVRAPDADLSAVAAQIKKLREDSGLKVSLVGWSRGGIIAREVARQTPALVRMVITLGSPFAAPGASNVRAIWRLLTGQKYEPPTPERVSRLAQPIPVPSTSIYTRADGVVAWRACLEEEGGERENVEVNTTHIGLGFHAPALWVIADRLAQLPGTWKPFEPSPMLAPWFPRASRSSQK